MYHGVISVEPLDDFQLKLEFDNHEIKILDMKPFLDKGVFKELKDEALFRRVRVSFDTVDWDNRIDLDPEFLYAESINTTQIKEFQSTK